ncbi:uncharacterized protein LOC108825193 [Raphanus sativus]|uniref:50S ribosomal protein L33, chloroplastic n=1 Tax=Raphanus sativus TaxID=3726 RepID=A0A6J0L325_RAPSA|nr:uncharacterized protein LOC108825193 [Raphanus sativus]
MAMAPGVRTVNLLYQRLRTSYEDEEANEVVDEGRSLLILSLVVYGFLVEVLSNTSEILNKRKKTFMFIRLVSAAGTGFFYVKRKSSKGLLEKLEFRKYDTRVNRHVLFTEQKMK